MRVALLADLGQHLVGVGRVADRRGGEREQLLDPLVLRDLERLADEGAQLLGAVVGEAGAAFEMVTEPQLGLMGVNRGGPGAAVRVNHQEMHRVGAHVQDTESHTLTLLGRTRDQHHDPWREAAL